MNEYGQLAMEWVHAEATEVFRQIEDPETVFEQLGERIAAQVDVLANALGETSSTTGEGYLDRVGRLGTVLRQAEEIAMHEALAEYLPPTPPEGGRRGLTAVPVQGRIAADCNQATHPRQSMQTKLRTSKARGKPTCTIFSTNAVVCPADR